VTPISTATKKAGRAINVPNTAAFMAITPDGQTVYVVSPNSPNDIYNTSTVTPISTATDTAGKPIMISSGGVDAIAITPNGQTAYVADNQESQGTTVTPTRVGSISAQRDVVDAVGGSSATSASQARPAPSPTSRSPPPWLTSGGHRSAPTGSSNRTGL